jgi:uncharacterized membrane protein
MDKTRLEAFSDGVFAIVLTLLIFNIQVPILTPPLTNEVVWKGFLSIYPHLIIFFITFAVISVFWINHHFLFHGFVKSIDRWLNLMNLWYLMFIVFIPFSASFMGAYHAYWPAAVIYGTNLLLTVLMGTFMINYIKAKNLLSDEVSQRTFKQARFRTIVSLFCYFAGIVFAFVNTSISVFFYVFPVIFNIIPGTLDFTERLLGFTIE